MEVLKKKASLECHTVAPADEKGAVSCYMGPRLVDCCTIQLDYHVCRSGVDARSLLYYTGMSVLTQLVYLGLVDLIAQGGKNLALWHPSTAYYTVFLLLLTVCPQNIHIV